ncbi:MAG TPA: hypothetical protein VFL91_25370 [Thermomicrobiales bacterium]|nr:hypothetical protein [Thermomicrobiales bacterium]
MEATLAAALAAFRTRVGAEPAHIAIHPDDAAVLAAATTLPVHTQRACPRGQVRLALP